MTFYTRNIPKQPVPITRACFVDLIFDLGEQADHSYSSIMAAVELGDAFVNYRGPRTPYLLRASLDDQSIDAGLCESPVPQVYSVELAHAVSVIIAKINEDYGYSQTRTAIEDTDNLYTLKIEWEVCLVFDFRIRVNNLMTLMGDLLDFGPIETRVPLPPSTIDYQRLETPGLLLNKSRPILQTPSADNSDNSDSIDIISPSPLISLDSLFFFDLVNQVCHNPTLLAMNPWTLMAGILLLNQAGKLQATRALRFRLFVKTMVTVAQETEVPLDSLLRGYIRSREDPAVLDPSRSHMVPSGTT